MADLTNTQKKEWARTLYLRENLTQQEIADRVGVSRVTVSNWCRGGKWRNRRSDSRSHDVSKYKASIVRWPKSTTQYSSNQRDNDTLMLSRLTLS